MKFETGKIAPRWTDNKFACLLELVYYDDDVIVAKVSNRYGNAELVALMLADQCPDDIREIQYYIGFLAQAKAREVERLKEFGNSLFGLR